jgi:putrescine aminotransferase
MPDTPLTNAPTALTARLQETDLRHHMHPFTDHQELARDGGPMVIERAEGVYIWDTDGQCLLDGMAGLWCVGLGYGRADLTAAATKQMQQLPYYNTFFKTSTPVIAELAADLADIAPKGMNRVFFANSGSEANDTNIRLAQTYWARMGQPGRRAILSRKYAYHGSTIAAASLTGLTVMHDIPSVPIPDIYHAPAPFWWAEGGTQSPQEHGLRTARGLEDMILSIGPENIAAFIGEPVMGAGGVIVPPPGYWHEVQRILRKYDILLIADEVITGFGRTGNWFGCETYDITPDIMTIAKGLSSGYLPISGSIISDRIADVLMGQPGRFAHGYTYSGHPVAAAVARETIVVMKRERIVERVRDDIGPYLQTQLATLLDHPLVGEVRGVGLMAAVELTRDKTGRAPVAPVGDLAGPVRTRCFNNGLVTRAVRDCLVFSPPLIITRQQVDELVSKLRVSLDG